MSSGKRIVLIAHYCITFRSILKAAFEHRGYRVVLAESGDGVGNAMFAGRHPDIALVSFHLPVRGGVETVTELRKEKVIANAVKFVILIEAELTGCDRQQIIENCGAIIKRPMGEMTPDRLVAHIEEMLSEAA